MSEAAFDHSWEGLEALERRVVLSGGEFSIYSPEGFAHDGVTEVVTIANTGGEASAYELMARYETGERDQVLASGTLGAGEIREVTIATAGDPASRLVRKAAPFSLELSSEHELSATLRHDDFGGVIVQSFQAEASDTWSFGLAERAGSARRDFIVMHNPGDAAVQVTLTGVTADGQTFTLTRTVEAHRRSGWDLRREGDLPSGEFGVLVESTGAIVVSRSHYDVQAGLAYGQLGQADGGALAGVVLGLEFDDDWFGSDGQGFDDSPNHDDDGTGDQGQGDNGGDDDGTPDQGPGDDPGDDPGGDDNPGGDDGTPDQGPGDDPGGAPGGDDNPGGGDDGTPDQGPGDFPGGTGLPSVLSLLNVQDQAAMVELTVFASDDTPAFTPVTTTVQVGAGERLDVLLASLGVPFDEEMAIVYESDVPVTVSAQTVHHGRLVGVGAVTQAATGWQFTGPAIDRIKDGELRTEDVFLFNPTGQSIQVTITFLFSDGRVVTETKSLDPFEVEDVDAEIMVNDLAELGVTVSIEATGTIVAALEQSGLSDTSYTLGAMPTGTVTDLGEIL